ncbi:MAG: hypothetical protein COA88_09220 [Kordia sp.]|nr:MAG: hypothetical protein COA88_09220 [Kordia sp.]
MLNTKENKLKFRYYILVLLCWCLVSCKNEAKDTEQVYDEYYRLANIGWKSKKINRYINTINYTATEVPIVYYILKDQGSSDLKKVDSIYNAHIGL